MPLVPRPFPLGSRLYGPGLDHQCLLHRHLHRHLHNTVALRATHYDALSLQPTATPAEIKKQFFQLSKLHHPDKNPDDPSASSRFVKISEAYHVLSVPEKRAQYDAQISAAQGGGSSGRGHAYPKGSYSSTSFAGGRPATGLNKRRGTFRGPPPSFYKSGGYGKHGAKRAEYAYQNTARAEEDTQREQDERTAGRQHPGYGTGQTGRGYEVPHFDDQRHKRTHDNIHEYIHGKRKGKRVMLEEQIDKTVGGTVVQFVLVSGAVGITALIYLLLPKDDAWKRDSKERMKTTEKS